MSLQIASLNSGSNGNCYYISNEKEAVFVDAGISCRETEKRMKRLGLGMDKVKGIFVSHEHSDHIKGIEGLSRKYQLPVFVTRDTLRACGRLAEKRLINFLKPGEPVDIGGLRVNSFSKYHDACDPQSFTITGNHVTVGVFTDIGHSCKEVIRHFKKCHAVFLESNYCEKMLEEGNYPVYLKKRISADTGHLSNNQALELFLKYRGKHLNTLILSHLSKNNNHPDLVNRIFNQHAGPVNISVASRYQESGLYSISIPFMKLTTKNQRQLSLFPA